MGTLEDYIAFLESDDCSYENMVATKSSLLNSFSKINGFIHGNINEEKAKKISSQVVNVTGFNQKGRYQFGTNYGHRTLKRATKMPVATDKSILKELKQGEIPDLSFTLNADEKTSEKKGKHLFQQSQEKQVRIKLKHQNREEANTAIEYYIQGPTVEHDNLKN